MFEYLTMVSFGAVPVLACLVLWCFLGWGMYQIAIRPLVDIIKRRLNHNNFKRG